MKGTAMIDKIAEYRKAIAAFVVPALIVLAASFADGTVTVQEWIAVAIAALGTSVAVGAIPNVVTTAQIVKSAVDPTAVAAALVREENRRNGFPSS